MKTINSLTQSIAKTWRRILSAPTTWYTILIEWSIIVCAAYFFTAPVLLDFDSRQLQQTGEHNESSTRPLLAEIGILQNQEIPLWNHYMQTGFPHAGDLLGHFWSPIATLPVILWGGINGMKVSIFISFVLAGIGQWYLAQVSGLKGIFRLWSSLMFMFSGGLAFLWRLGWYELLIGMAWFPWTFAAFWQALKKRDITSLAWTAFCVAMILFTGGGYYPFYLIASAGTMLIVALIAAQPEDRIIQIKRSITIAVFGAGLIAVMALPIYDGYRLIVRESGEDVVQQGSQPVSYALMNYAISQGEWFNSDILGTASGWNWFYTGPLMLGALIFLPLAFQHSRKKALLAALLAMSVVLLLWVANRYQPVKYIYDHVNFLYRLRFPNRLLILTASPLLILAAASLQGLLVVLRKQFRNYRLSFSYQNSTFEKTLQLRGITTIVFIVILFFSLKDVYLTNHGFGFVPTFIEEKSLQALRYLKNQDNGMYYINLGGGALYWSWTPAAYIVQIPVINFNYNQHLLNKDSQNLPDAPFAVIPKYQFSPVFENPPGATLLKDFEGVGLWYFPDALPFAFTAPADEVITGGKLDPAHITEATARYDGPNRVIVKTSKDHTGEIVVALVSNYPGWKVLRDGEPILLTPVNEYLGAPALPGEHTYTFIFDPPLHKIGLVITLLTIFALLFFVHREQLN